MLCVPLPMTISLFLRRISLIGALWCLCPHTLCSGRSPFVCE
jgi:hypothetical protein